MPQLLPHQGFRPRNGLGRELPPGFFVMRPQRSVKQLVPFVRTLANAFADLHRLSKTWGLPVAEPAKQNQPITQRDFDSKIHAAKRTYSSVLKQVRSEPTHVLVGGNRVRLADGKKYLKNAAERLRDLKSQRRKLQPLPGAAVVIPVAPAGDNDDRQRSSRPPSYFRRLERRALLRANASLKAELDFLSQQPPPPAPVMAPQVVAPPLVERLDKGTMATPSPKSQFKVLEAAMASGPFAISIGVNAIPFQRISFPSPFGTVVFLRNKPKDEEVRMGFKPTGGAAAFNLGICKSVRGQSYFTYTGTGLTVEALWVIASLYTFATDMPAPWSQEPELIR